MILRRKRKVLAIFNSADRMLVLGEYWKEQMQELVDVDKITVLYE